MPRLQVTVAYYYSLVDGQQSMLGIVKLRQGSGKDRQGMGVKAKGLKA